MGDCDVHLSETELYHKIILILVSTVIAISGTSLNSYVLHAIRTHVTLQTYANGFVINLCIADIISIASVAGCGLAKMLEQHVLQQITEMLYHISYDVTILMITVIAADRYACLRYSLNYSSRMTGKKVTIVVSLSWIYSTATTLLPFVPSWTTNTCSFVDGSHTFYLYLISAVLLLIPCVIGLCIMYAKLCTLAQRHSQNITAVDMSVSFNYPNYHVQRSRKYVKTLLQILSGIFLLVLPSKICFIFIKNESAQLYCMIIGSINCLLNPIIYACIRSEFRNAVRPIASLRSSVAWRYEERREEEVFKICGSEMIDGSSPINLEIESVKGMDTNTEIDSAKDNVSFQGFYGRQNSYSSRVSVKLNDNRREMELTIEDIECEEDSSASIQLNIERIGRSASKVTFTSQYSLPSSFSNVENINNVMEE